MKRVLLFILLISFIGYSQNPIQPNIPNFEDGLPQDLVEKMKPINLEFGDDEMMNFNPTKKGNIMESKSFQRVVMVENNNSNTLRLDGFSSLRYFFEYPEEGVNFIGSINDKTEVEFDENGNLTLSIYYYWSSESQSFIPLNKSEYTYDENGNWTLSITYYWSSESQSFVPGSKYEYTYDENGNWTLHMRYWWSSESQSFVPSSKEEHTYDDNGNQTLFIQYIWDSESQSFVPSQKYEFSFDENGNQTLYIQYIWDSESQSLVLSGKVESSYDDDGNQTLFIKYNWNSESQSFVPQTKLQYSYDENGNQTLYIRYFWDSVIEVFHEFSKEMKSYDEFGYVLDYEIHNWIEELGQVKPVNKTVYSTLSETETNLVREGIIYEYDTNSNTWNELEGEEFKSYFYYTKTSSLSTNSVELNSFSIYPNPTKGNLNINSSESLTNPIIELYDVKGSKIISNPFNFSEPIDVSGLQPSIYIYLIKDGNEVKQSGKVIKE